ncbi:protein kinase C delta type-like [Ranitomeya variabilis]|uniref:protein kinase C delta type-like n=1 Tax=Ranitomeya variabilis TaxID=490064 RepID=UPI00405737B2
MGRKRKCGEKNKKSAKKRCMEESFSQRGETSQDIVQDVPVEKTDDPCTPSSGYPPERKALKKGTKRGNSSPEKEDETPNKRGKIVETSQDIVQDVPVEKTDDPCTTSSGYPPEIKTLKKGTKRGNSSPEKEDGTPNKRGRMVESESGKDVTSDKRFSGSAKIRSSHLHHERVENQSCREHLKRKRTSDTETTTKRRRETDKSIDQAPEGVIGAQTTSPSEQVTACLSLESFIFTRMLGEGGFGRVMLATHQPSGHQLAVKMVKKRKLLEYAKHNLRLEREVLEITEDSRFFTHAYGTFQTADYAFYAMEYLSGGDLTAFINSRGALDVCTTRFLAAEILSGIEFLHSRGIIHRDLKPDNILLDGDGHAKIADFGLAAMNVFGSQKISEFCGTPGYLAPEIYRLQPFNYTVDLFAFGVIVFQMATGYYPFYSGQCLRRLAYSVKWDKPCYPYTMDSQLRNVIERLLCKSPEKRQDVCSNLKGHPFFSTINWEELEAGRSRPPFTMTPIPILETSKQMELDQVMSGTEAQEPPITPEDHQLFCGFSYISNRWKSIESRRNNGNGNIT